MCPRLDSPLEPLCAVPAGDVPPQVLLGPRMVTLPRRPSGSAGSPSVFGGTRVCPNLASKAWRVAGAPIAVAIVSGALPGARPPAHEQCVWARDPSSARFAALRASAGGSGCAQQAPKVGGAERPTLAVSDVPRLLLSGASLVSIARIVDNCASWRRMPSMSCQASACSTAHVRDAVRHKDPSGLVCAVCCVRVQLAAAKHHQ